MQEPPTIPWLAWDWRPVLVCLVRGEGDDDAYAKVIDFDVTQDDAEAKLKRYVGLHGPQNKHKNSEEHYANLKKAYEDPAIRERLREEQVEMHPYSERRRSRPKDVEASSSTAASSGTAAPPTTSAIASPQLYPKPSQTWLTWAANPEFGDGYYLRCLMCGKWVSDWDSIDTGSHGGLHGGPVPDNQKEHAKKLASLHEFGS